MKYPETFLDRLRSIPRNNVLLYIHIPFCSRKCDYCDFFSMPLEEDLLQPVLDNILDQLALFINRLDYPGIATIYIGGGTPNAIPLPLLDRFFSGLWKVIAPCLEKGEVRECTVESNPELISEEQLRLFGEHGIDRLSVGVQTLQEGLLTRLGRNTTCESTRAGLELIKNVWNRRLNIDLIYGIPGQAISHFIADLSTVLHYGPDHISLYELSYEPETRLTALKNRMVFQPVGDETVMEMWNVSTRLLEEEGYTQYEISNYARPGGQCLHNLFYWKLSPYVGCGPAAVSTLPGRMSTIRVENCGSVHRFLEGKPALWNMDYEVIDSKTFLFEHFLMGLRMVEGVDLHRIDTVFHISIEEQLHHVFTDLQQRNLLRVNNGKVRLTGEGQLLLNHILLELLEQLDKVEAESISWP